jgi:hypothetical protein
MDEPVRVTFYTTAAGFFAYGAKNPSFGNLDDSLSQLEEWGRDAALSVTKLLDPAEDSDELPVYLLGAQRIGRDWLLGLWNEIPTSDNTVASIAMNSVVGSPEIHQNDTAPNTIAGYATYFWAIPEHGVVASLRFAGGSAGRRAMEGYVRNFLALESKYVVEQTLADGTTAIIGHSETGRVPPQSARPRFKLSTYKKKGKRAYLLEHHERIRKVIRRGQVTLDNLIERGLFQNFVRFVRGDGDQPNVVTGTRAAKIELEYTPTLPELNAMIEADDNDQEGSRWDDLGFELAGEAGNVIWINKSRASDNYEFDVERTSGVVTLESIARAIAHQRDEMLELLKDA